MEQEIKTENKMCQNPERKQSFVRDRLQKSYGV